MSTNLDRNLNSRIGCHCWGTNPVSVAAIPTFAESGCRWVRATRPMQWDTVSGGRGVYRFAENGEASIDLALSHGMSIMGILDARWGNETLRNELPFASPVWEHLDQWADFVAAAVRFYRDRVKYWEIINEPPFFWWYPTPAGIPMPAVNTPTKRAPIWAYAKLLQTSAKVIRELDPEAKVVVGSGFPDGLFLKRLYELGCRDAFDIASVHYLNCKHPDDFARGMRCLRAVMRQFGDEAKPLWDTENGPGGAVIGQSVQTPDEYAGLYNVYRHCFACEQELARYFWFNPVAAREAGVSHGASCRNADGSLASAYRAMQELTSRIGEAPLTKAVHLEGEVHAYVFATATGPQSILWSTAPATARLPGFADATTHLGEPCQLSANGVELTGRPLFINGDVSGVLDATVHGKRETVVAPMKQPPASTAAATSPQVPQIPAIGDVAWKDIPFLAKRAEIPVVAPNDHFCMVMSSVEAEVQIAHTADALGFRVRTWDPLLLQSRPTGLVQFSLRDSDPDVTEWAFFYNAYGLFNLFASPRGPLFLRYEHMRGDEYPAGVVAGVEFEVKTLADGLLFWARIPWREIGPCRPGRHNPFLLQMTFNRADHMLAVPDTDSPEEWSHNFADNFIVKPPALARWVTFA